MRKTDAFSEYHPLTNFLYFALVIGFTMVCMHPVTILLSFFCAIGYGVELKSGSVFWKNTWWIVPLVLLASVLNPAFNHEGATILCYLPTGNPLTRESICYGVASGMMLGAVVLWFVCYTELMTSDKLVYLFGRVLPACSLLLSMSLRFIPLFFRQAKRVREARRILVGSGSAQNAFGRMRSAVSEFSILVTWALEHAVETADSMNGRGYGLPGRTAYSTFRFERRDLLLLIWLLICGTGLTACMITGRLSWTYFPVMDVMTVLPDSAAAQCMFAALCFTPVVINQKESRKWNYFE